MNFNLALKNDRILETFAIILINTSRINGNIDLETFIYIV